MINTCTLIITLFYAYKFICDHLDICLVIFFYSTKNSNINLSDHQNLHNQFNLYFFIKTYFDFTSTSNNSKICLIFNHDYILLCNNNLTRFRRFVKRNNQTLLEKSHTLQFHVRTFFYCILRLFSSSEGGSARADHVPQRRSIHSTNSIIYISLWFDTLVTRMRRILTKCRFVGKCRIFIANSISVCNPSIRVKRF